MALLRSDLFVNTLRPLTMTFRTLPGFIFARGRRITSRLNGFFFAAGFLFTEPLPALALPVFAERANTVTIENRAARRYRVTVPI